MERLLLGITLVAAMALPAYAADLTQSIDDKHIGTRTLPMRHLPL